MDATAFGRRFVAARLRGIGEESGDRRAFGAQGVETRPGRAAQAAGSIRKRPRRKGGQMTHLEIWLQTPLAAAIGWTLFHSLWEGVIVAVALAVTLALTRSARARYTAACLAMCAIIICFGVTLVDLMPRHQTPVAARNSIVLGWSSRVDLPD